MSTTSAAAGHGVPQAPVASANTVLGATERLRQSRQMMRDQMLVLNASSAAAHATNKESGHQSAVLATLTALPLLGPLIDSAMTWWAEHPLHAVVDLFSRPNPSADEPLTQRHPWAMLLGAAAVGALLMWTRPWRFALLRRAVYAGLLPQMVTTLLSRVSTEGLLNLVSSFLRRPGANHPPPATSSQPPAERDGAAPNSTLH